MNQNFTLQISEFSELEDWRDSQQEATSCNHFIYSICDLLATDDRDRRIKVWVHAVNYLARESPNPYQDFLTAEAFLSKHSLSFLSLSVEIATAAVLEEEGYFFQRCAMEFANKTGLVAFRFLSAWTLLNTDQLSKCIEECLKVDDLFSPILTLLGQAYLESHDPKSAITALEKAVDIDPNEVLAWFQLAKSYSVLDQEEDAWNCLLQCKRLSHYNIEVAAFLAMNAVKAPSMHKLELAWKELTFHLSKINGDSFAIELLFELALLQNDPQKMTFLVSQTNWRALQSQIGGQINTYINRLQEIQWQDALSVLGEKLA